MKNTLKTSLLLVLSFVLFSFQSSITFNQSEDFSVPKPWVKLGTKKVSKGADHDVMMVTAREGKFQKLKLKVTHSRVHINTIKVVYGNGTSNLVVVDRNFQPGDTKIVDLPGNKRIIKKIVFNYHTKFFALGKARIHVLGKH